MKKYHKLNYKIGAFFLILVFLIAVGIGELIYRINYNDALDFTAKRLVRCGNYVDDVIDEDMIATWLNKGEDDSYKRTENELEGIQSCFELSYVFVYIPERDVKGEAMNDVTFIFDLNPEDDTESPKRKLGERSSNRREFEMTYTMLETGEPQTTEELQTSNEGKLLTAFVPLHDKNGTNYGVIGICCTMESVRRFAWSTSIVLVTAVELVIILFAAILLIFIHRRVIKPVKLLSERMNHFVTKGESFNDSYVTEIQTHDEIEQMADNFNNMADSIKKYTDDLKQITAAQERLRAEFDVAGSIRSAVSSETTYPAFTERSDFELYASLKNTVYNSCSFCKFFLIDEDHLFIVLGESVGKTLPSMLMSMLAATNITALAKMREEPYRIAYETNNSLCSFERDDMSMTVSALIVLIDLKRGRMKYVNAGMPPLIIKHTGELYDCASDNIQFNLGEMHGVSFEQKTLTLNQGETLFFTSYGVSEMKNESGEKYTQDRILTAVNEIAVKNYPLDEMVEKLEQNLDAFRGDVPSELDTTILGFRYLG